MFAYVLTIKGQICCMAVLLYIAWTYFSVKRSNTTAHRLFTLLLISSIINDTFDMITVYTINHVHEIPLPLNHFLHIIYMSSMATALYLFFFYIRNLAYNDSKFRAYHLIPLVIAVLGSIFLKFDYVESVYGNYSWGPYATVAFVSAYFYLLCAGIIMVRRGKYMESKSRRAISISMLFMFATVVIQGMYPEILITSLSLMMINVALFYTVESPDALLIESLAKERKKAESANQAKSLFLAQMSHEIRTPINAILGMNEMIIREADNEDIRDYSSNIKEAGKTLLALINSILDFSKIEDNKMEILSIEYDTAGLINNIVNSIYNRARSKGLYFEINVDEKLPSRLVGDDVRLTQVIMNLLTNAVKYTEKGTVTFSIAMERSTDDVATLKISVKDTGIGIREEDMEGIFDSFQRLDEKRNRNIEGTGLGMSIVDRLLKMMGSKIEIDSTYGEGSNFYFTINQKIADPKPVGDYKKRLMESRKAEAGDLSFRADGARVLIVDDNSMNHKVAKNLLKLVGVVPDSAMSGAEAIELVKKNHYHIICLDHMMPEMDGIETLELMRSQGVLPDDTKVFAMTANAVVGAKEMYLEKGFDDYISKPIEIEVLVDKLNKFLPDDILNAGNTATVENEDDMEVLEFAPEGDDEDTITAPAVDSGTKIERIKELGVNVTEGLVYCINDNDFYLEMISDYCSSHEEKSRSLDGFLANGNLDEYKIMIHALKSMSRTIGANDVADLAMALEQAANRNDAAYVKENHPAFKAAYKKLSDGLSQAIS